MYKPKSSWFPLTHTNTLTLDMPYLTPVLCTDIIPGDTWRLSTEIFMRMEPLLAPIMQDVDVYCHYFYVPLRLVVMDYDKYFNPEEQENVFRPFIYPVKFADYLDTNYPDAVVDDIPVDVTQQTTEQKRFLEDLSLMCEGSLADYLGIPVLSLSDYVSGDKYDASLAMQDLRKISKFSAIPFLMYQKVYDEFYRDQSLETPVLERLDTELDGFLKGKFNTDEPFDVISLAGFRLLMGMRLRAWKKDYFTSALPTPQSGPDVHLPLTGDAPVRLQPNATGQEYEYTAQLIRNRNGVPAQGSIPPPDSLGFMGTVTGESGELVDSNFTNVILDPNGTMVADMENVTSATINELRRAVRAQEFLEKCARGGRRYIEMILAHFGVKSSDARLDRPEFLGGGRQPFTISEVLSHVGEDDNSNFVLGEMGGHGVSYGNSRPTKRFFEEHGFLFSIVSVLPKASYQQGLARMWTRETIYDYAWPTFANLGEQEIRNKEIYATSDDPDGTFGYAPRYSEYKFIPSSVHGAMRSSLSYWHLGRKFSQEPALNADFVHPRPEELKRIFAVQDGTQNITALIKHHIQSKRRLPKYGIPTL